MPFLRYFAVVLLVAAAAILLTGALKSQPRSPVRITPNPEVNAAAVQVLDDAIARLDPSRVGWLETKLWQKGRLDRFAYESEGRCLVGPDHRFRLELSTRQGRTAASALTISDGATLWQGRRNGDGRWTDVTRTDLAQALQESRNASVPLARDAFLNGQSLSGVVGLLHTARTRVAWSRKETVRRDGRTFVKLTGSWSAESAAAFAPSGKPWPNGLPRLCRLYLDEHTLWPHRVEWWGPDVPRTADVLLLQMEFRDPVLNQPLSAERCAREFALPVAAAQPYNP
jgi:hypothetical protein